MGFYFIYFYGTEVGTEVKLGRTKQRIPVRRGQHENQNGHDLPMRTLAVVLGQRSDEEVLKRHFRPWRSRVRSDEWIDASEDSGREMRGYLRWLRAQPFVAREESELLRLQPVDGSEWLPGPHRERQPAQLRLAAGDPWDDLAIDLVTEGDFYTHPTFLEAARETMRGIDLDPASCSEANEVVAALRFYGFRENGLLQQWEGRVWCNPPYGNWAEWAPKIVAEWHSGRVEAMCVLASSRVTTAQVFHPIVREASAVFIACGRYPFWGPNATGSPDEGHLVFYFGHEPTRFRSAFSAIGSIYLSAVAA